MSRTGRAVLALIGLVAVAGSMIGCDDFFVSPNSLASITVSPTTAVLSSASGAGTLTISASGTLVNGNSSTISPTWTSSDTNCAVISFSASGCLATASGTSVTVTPVTGAGNTAKVTATSGGQTVTVPIDVLTGTISGITINLSSTSVTPPGTVNATVVTTDSGLTIPANFVTWTTPSGATISGSGNSAVFTFVTATAGTTATITATVTTNGGSSLTATSASITVI